MESHRNERDGGRDNIAPYWTVSGLRYLFVCHIQKNHTALRAVRISVLSPGGIAATPLIGAVCMGLLIMSMKKAAGQAASSSAHLI